MEAKAKDTLTSCYWPQPYRAIAHMATQCNSTQLKHVFGICVIGLGVSKPVEGELQVGDATELTGLRNPALNDPGPERP